MNDSRLNSQVSNGTETFHLRFNLILTIGNQTITTNHVDVNVQAKEFSERGFKSLFLDIDGLPVEVRLKLEKVPAKGGDGFVRNVRVTGVRCADSRKNRASL